jgi:hypothetical protein
MLEENSKATALNVLQNSQNCLASVARTGSFGSGHASGEMRLGGWVSRTQSASLLRFRAAHGAANRQYLSQCEFLGLHTNIIERQSYER